MKGAVMKEARPLNPPDLEELVHSYTKFVDAQSSRSLRAVVAVSLDLALYLVALMTAAGVLLFFKRVF